MITAKIIKDSVSTERQRITTFVLTYPRFIHGEFMTHRLFSRNAQSSRAIPVNKVLKQVWSNPVVPMQWERNQPGMQSSKPMGKCRKWFARKAWGFGAKMACISAWAMMKLGLHKQWANRVLEPFQSFTVIVTATEWNNFFKLRQHKDAQPEINDLANKMYKALIDSSPRVLQKGQWHLPFITDSERREIGLDYAIKCSVARCARVSYLTHDNEKPTLEKDLALYNRLVGSDPIHASPAEHQAEPDWYNSNSRRVWKRPELHGNFTGWVQYRKILEMPYHI